MMNKKGGMAFYVWYVVLIAGFFVGFLIVDTVDFHINLIVDQQLEDMNETAVGKGKNNTYLEDWIDVKSTVYSNWTLIKTIYFWGGVISLIIYPVVYGYIARARQYRIR